jgi:mannose-6-phosphate isomerase
MKRLYKLVNCVKHYDWGSPHWIPDLLGRPNPAGEPWAELWMGVHPGGPSSVEVRPGEKGILLKDLIAAGHWCALTPQCTLPFLFKLLAAEKPLSIQAHPTKEQAVEGFDRENRAGIPLDSLIRNYKDKNHKPEIIVALTPFEALAGFREDMTASQIRDLCTGAALAGGAKADINYFASYLNPVHLEPGQGMYIPAGILHAYIHGFGVELMANSDNVLRGGCTTKHVDVDELLHILSYKAFKPEVITGPHYLTPVREFDLWRIEAGAEPPVQGPGIALVTKGSVKIAAGLDAGQESLVLNQGESAFIADGTQFKFEGRNFRAFFAAVPCYSL